MVAQGYLRNPPLTCEGFSGFDQGYFNDGSRGNFLKFRNGAHSKTLHHICSKINLIFTIVQVEAYALLKGLMEAKRRQIHEIKVLLDSAQLIHVYKATRHIDNLCNSFENCELYKVSRNHVEQANDLIVKATQGCLC